MASTSTATGAQDDQHGRRLRATAALTRHKNVKRSMEAIWATGFVDGSARDAQQNDEEARLRLLGADLERAAKAKMERAVGLLRAAVRVVKIYSCVWAKESLKWHKALVQADNDISDYDAKRISMTLPALEAVRVVVSELRCVTEVGMTQMPESGPLKYLQKRLLFVSFTIICCIQHKSVCVEKIHDVQVGQDENIVRAVRRLLVLQTEVRGLQQRVAKTRKRSVLSRAEQDDKLRLPAARAELQEVKKTIEAAKQRLKDCDALSPITEIHRRTLLAALKSLDLAKELYTEEDKKFGQRPLPFWTVLVEAVFAESAQTLAGRLVQHLVTPEDRDSKSMEASCVASLKDYVEQVSIEHANGESWNDPNVVEKVVEEKLNPDGQR